MEDTKTTTVQIRIETEVRKAIEKRADELGLNTANYIRFLINKDLKEKII